MFFLIAYMYYLLGLIVTIICFSATKGKKQEADTYGLSDRDIKVCMFLTGMISVMIWPIIVGQEVYGFLRGN